MTPLDLQPAAPAQATGEQPRNDPAKLRHAAESFEAMLLQTMLREMREAQLENGFFGQSAGASIYEGMFESHLSESLSGGSPLGIADALMKQWQRGPGGEAPPEAVELEGKIRELRARRNYGAAVDSTRSAGAAVAAAPTRVAHGDEHSGRATPPALPHGHNEPLHSALDDKVDRSGFGWRKDPIDGARRFHAGVDLPAAKGTPVVSVAPGRVLEAGESGGYGLQVTVEHADGWTSRYAHLSKIEVRPGDRIPRGARLGRVGSSGRSTGPHLHFETARFGEPVDPAKAAPGPIRPQVLASPADVTTEHRVQRGS